MKSSFHFLFLQKTIPTRLTIITTGNTTNNNKGLKGSALVGPVSLHASHHSSASAAHKAETLGVIKGISVNAIIIKSLVFIF